MAQASAITLPLQPPPPPKKRPYTKKLKKWIETWVKTQKEAEYKWKKTQKGMEYSVREHIGKFIDRLTLNDVAELMATIALTPVVKKVIDESEQLRGLFFGVIKQATSPTAATTKTQWEISTELKLFRWFKAYTGTVGKEMAEYEGLFPDWMDWIISFGLAYLIVHNFGALIHAAGETVKSIKNILEWLVAGISAL
jgi:hypothetical protein